MKGKVFTAQEVQAMLNGSKRMFREVIKGAELEISHPAIHSWAQSPNDHKFYAKAKNDEVKQQYVTTFPFHGIKCPYQVGQKIFCKESFLYGANGEIQLFDFNYEGYCSSYWKRKPAQHMKQEHSRLTPLIKEIRVERLASISEEDAINEGVDYFSGTEPPLHSTEWYEPDSGWFNYEEDEYTCEGAVESFATLWDATHKKPEEKFEANPWVWVVQFEK